MCCYSKASFVSVCIAGFCFSVCLIVHPAKATDIPMVGIPISAFGSSGEIEDDICPEGTRVVETFMAAWQRDDYDTMYSLLDDQSRGGYSFEQAKFEFQFMEFKSYKISSVRKVGEDFEFLLSYGEWQDADKEMKKMIISGDSKKIVLQRDRSFFKRSL
jgi:hypothetical protein